MIAALVREMELQQSYLGDELIETIYVGGGTPSMMSADHLALLLSATAKIFRLAPVETTLEANPDDLSDEKLAAFRSVGIDRLSIGIQSFDDDILKFLNRAHTATDAIRCLDRARRAGFENVSVDLIYAIPGQDNRQWKKNISQAVALAPEHISSYALTIEEKTPFGKWQKQGKFTEATDETAAAQMEMLMSDLAAGGYEQYEISNFCKTGFHSRHNSSYWQQKKYLGIGPSAHSFDLVSRQYNISNNAMYMRSIAEDTIPFQKEMLTRENKINEYLFTSLRTSWGCDLRLLKDRFEVDLWKESGAVMEMLLRQQLVVIANDTLRLTSPGKLLADKIASDLFVMG